MGKLFKNLRDRIEDALRGMCGRMNPDMRVYTIVVLMVVFAVVNIWLTFSAIYSIGREDKRIEQIRITPITVPDFVPADGESAEPEQDDNFNQHFNTEENDTTEIEQGKPEL